MKNIINNIIHPTTRRTSNRLPMPEPVRKGFRRYSCAVLTGSMILGLAMPAYAAGDPLTVVNKPEHLYLRPDPCRGPHFVGLGHCPGGPFLAVP